MTTTYDPHECAPRCEECDCVLDEYEVRLCRDLTLCLGCREELRALDEQRERDFEMWAALSRG